MCFYPPREGDKGGGAARCNRYITVHRESWALDLWQERNEQQRKRKRQRSKKRNRFARSPRRRIQSRRSRSRFLLRKAVPCSCGQARNPSPCHRLSCSTRRELPSRTTNRNRGLAVCNPPRQNSAGCTKRTIRDLVRLAQRSFLEMLDGRGFWCR